MKTTNTYGATLIDVMGSDLTVVNAARVSFDKASEFEEVEVTDWEDHIILGPIPYTYKTKALKEADKRLIAYLAREGHWSPYSHPQLSFRVSAPIFVARQFQKHQVGLAWNEVSRRYVDSEPVFYTPGTGGWRAKASNVKQGSSDDIVWETRECDIDELMESFIDMDWSKLDNEKLIADPDASAEWIMYHAAYTYDRLLKGGVCPEQARMVLPQSTITEWVWTGSLAAFARVVNQRLEAHAQRECHPVARDIEKALEKHFPESWKALKNYEPN